MDKIETYLQLISNLNYSKSVIENLRKKEDCVKYIDCLEKIAELQKILLNLVNKESIKITDLNQQEL